MINKLRLLTPGPTPLPETVRLALARDMIHHRKHDFMALMHSVQAGLGELFDTKQPVLPLSSSGTGAMTAAIGNLFNPGEKVLVIDGGKFGERWAQIASSRGLDAMVLKVEWGSSVKAENIEAALAENPYISGVLVQLCETSTGVLMPVKELGKVCAARNTLLVVDGISGVGISPCPMDEWQIDCLLTGSQKGLMLPPGLALIALSEKAWKKAEKVKPACFYFNLKKERVSIEKDQTSFTTPVNLIFGLKASLDLLLENGLKSVYAHQWALTMMVRHGAKAIGLDMLVSSDFSWGLTSIKLPSHIDGSTLLSAMEKNYGVCMAGGQDQLKGRIVRFGHMGWVDWGDCLAGLAALEMELFELGGKPMNGNWSVSALAAYKLALMEGAGVNVDPALFLNL